MNKNIVVIGAGQLGSRHLQALAKIDDNATYYIVDPSENALAISRNRFQEVNSFNRELVCLKQINLLPREIEFAVISTNSKQRLQALKELFEQAKVKYLLLEKFLFPNVEDYIGAEKILNGTGTKVYVNCARRMWSNYRELKKKLEECNQDPLKIEVYGGEWNLASNSIHFLDLFLFLTNARTAQIDTSLLDQQLAENKRKGYVEFTGTLTIKTEKNDLMILTSVANSKELSKISIKNSHIQIEINELEEKIIFNGLEEKFPLHYQSNLTNKVYRQLRESGTCFLTTFSDSVKEHLLLLRTFKAFLNGREGAIT